MRPERANLDTRRERRAERASARALLRLLGVGLWLAGCAAAEAEPLDEPAQTQGERRKARKAVPKAEAEPTPTAEDVYKARCAMCHGESGKGDGPASEAYNPKPRDYSDPEWQKSVSDEHITKAILEGGPAVGKNPIMPAHPDLKDKPEVVHGLVKIIRGFATPEPQ